MPTLPRSALCRAIPIPILTFVLASRALAQDEEPPPPPAPATTPTLDLGIVADVALAGFSDEQRARQTGAHDPTANGFHLQQLELSIGTAIDPYFRFDADVVFGLDEVEIEEAYATTLDLPAGLQLRAGQFLTRFGRINPTHLHAWDFVDQTFAIGRVFGGEGHRGIGVELSWLTPLPWFVELVGSVTTPDTDADAVQGVAALKQFFELSDDLSLFWGLSAALEPNGDGLHTRSEVYGTDVYLKYRPISRASHTVISLQTEWLYRRREVPRDVLSDLTGYAQVFWRFAQRWGTAVRYELGTAAVGLDGDVALDPDQPDWTSARHRVAGSLTFYPTEFSRVRTQLSLDAPTWENEPVWAAFLALEVVGGAHGAHQF